jgi:excisionase family DNA binding protein
MSSQLTPSGHGSSSRGLASDVAGSRVTFEVLVHLAAALSAHERRLRRDGAVVPAMFTDLAGLLRDCVRARQATTALCNGVTDSDDDLMAERLLLTKGEVADQLGVSVRTVERLVAAGHLQLVSVEGARRIRVSDLAAYVDGLATASATHQCADPSLPTAGPRSPSVQG